MASRVALDEVPTRRCAPNTLMPLVLKSRASGARAEGAPERPELHVEIRGAMAPRQLEQANSLAPWLTCSGQLAQLLHCLLVEPQLSSG
jgi:hypothetical protein